MKPLDNPATQDPKEYPMCEAITRVPHHRMFIDGEWTDGTGHYDVINPADEQVVATVARAETAIAALEGAEACVALGRTDEAKDALRQGIAAAERFGHPSMAHDLSGRLEDLEDSA